MALKNVVRSTLLFLVERNGVEDAVVAALMDDAAGVVETAQEGQQHQEWQPVEVSEVDVEEVLVDLAVAEQLVVPVAALAAAVVVPGLAGIVG